MAKELLAPNGQPSKLTPEQYKLVRTPAFIAWFGDWINDPKNASKVVDENGEPLAVYHNTDKLFYEWNFKKINKKRGTILNGAYFTTIPDEQWGKEKMCVFLCIKEPLIFDFDKIKVNVRDIQIFIKENKWFWIEDLIIDKSQKSIELYKKNIDNGLIFKNTKYSGVAKDEYVVFKSEQIKLADGYNTTFDASNPDIRFAEGGKITDSENFKKWFKGSKVVDKDGQPLVVYHGTTSDFNKFSFKHLGSGIKATLGYFGFYFTDDKSLAEDFTRKKWNNPKSKFKEGARVISVYLNIKNPYYMTIDGFIKTDMNNKDKKDYDKFKKSLIKKGHDGVIVEKATMYWQSKMREFDGNQYIAFYPEQIKLADGSNTTFDASNPDIRFADGGKITDSENFKKWFAGSKVVDKDGQPLVVYHGSNKKFNIFNEKKQNEGLYGRGFYFSQFKEISEKFGNIISVYLSIKNPLIITPSKTPNILNKIIAGNGKYLYGYDGIMVYDSNKKLNTIVVYHSTQIKLSDGSNTTFDANNPDIRFAAGGSVNEIKKIEIPQHAIENFIYFHLKVGEESGIFNFDNAEDFSKEYLGYNIVKKVGAGTKGVAYLTDKNTVLKFTFSKHEADFCNSIKGKSIPYHAFIYNVKQIGNESLFIIEREYLNEINKDDRRFFVEMTAVEYRSKRKKISFEEELRNTKHSLWNDIEYTDADKQKMLEMHNHKKIMSDSFNELGLDVNDIDGGNIGLRDGVITCFDCVYAQGGEIKSNLTPEQLKIIKSHNFRMWFGDWMNEGFAERLFSLNDYIQISDKPERVLRDEESDLVKTLPRFKTQLGITGNEIEICRPTYEKILIHGASDVNYYLIFNLKQICNNSIFYDREPNKEPKDTYSKWFDCYFTKAIFRNEKYIIRFNVQIGGKKENDFKLHDVCATKEETIKAAVKDKPSSRAYLNGFECKDRKINLLCQTFSYKISKVIDSQGVPIVVFHGTPYGGHTVFNKTDSTETGIWLTENHKVAKGFAYNMRTEKPQIYQLFLNLKNPQIFDTWKQYEVDKRVWYKGGKKMHKALMAHGYDGIIIKESETDALIKRKDFIVFNSNQIKLSDGSNTTFDMNNLDIRYADGGKISHKTLKSILDSNEAYAILDSSEAKDTTWTSGGCAILALALNKAYGFPIYVINNYKKGFAEHFVVKSANDKYLDYDGAQSEKNLIKNFMENELITDKLGLLPYNENTKVQGIPLDHKAADKLAALIQEKKFSDGGEIKSYPEDFPLPISVSKKELIGGGKKSTSTYQDFIYNWKDLNVPDGSLNDYVWTFGYKNGKIEHVGGSLSDYSRPNLPKYLQDDLAFVIFDNDTDTQFWYDEKYKHLIDKYTGWFTEGTKFSDGGKLDLLEIDKLEFTPISNKRWKTLQIEGLDEEQDVYDRDRWVEAELPISEEDSNALKQFTDDVIEKYNDFDIALKEKYKNKITDFIDYDNGRIFLVKVKEFSAGGKLPPDKPTTDNQLPITEKIANLKKSLPHLKGKDKNEMQDYIESLELLASEPDFSEKYPRPSDIPQQAWDYLIKKFTSYDWKWYVDDGVKKYIKRMDELKTLIKEKDFRFYKKKDILIKMERVREFLDNPVSHNAKNHYRYVQLRKQFDDSNLGEWIIMNYKLSDVNKKYKYIIELAQQSATEDEFIGKVSEKDAINDLYKVFPDEKINGGWFSAARIIYKFVKFDGKKFFDGGSVASKLNISESDAKNIYHLPLEISVYVPSTKGVDEKISNTEFENRIAEVQKYLADMCGGFSADVIEGGYMSTKRELVKEGIVKVVSFCTKENYEKNKNQLLNKISEWSRLWTQEAIGFEFEGDMMYVPQKLANGGSPITDNRLLITEKIANLRKTLTLLDGREAEEMKAYIESLELLQQEELQTPDSELLTQNSKLPAEIKEPTTNNRLPITDNPTTDYYIAIGDKEHGFLRFEPVKGVPLKLKGLEGYDLFAYQDEAGKWYCTYGLTGHLVPSDLFFYDPFNFAKPTKSDFGFDSIEDMQLFFDSFNPEYLEKLTKSLHGVAAMAYLSPRQNIRQKGCGGYIAGRTMKINNVGKKYHHNIHNKKQQMLLNIHP